MRRMGTRRFARALVALLLLGSTGAAGEDFAYPLKLSPNGRYLVDQQNRPFLIQGDSPWSLIVQLTLPEVAQYLDDRREKRFNLLMVNLIEHQFSDNPPANRLGDEPFLVPGDYSTPNEAYFAHADAVLALAAERNFVVLLTPTYLGYLGGNEGWYQEMVANGTATLREYGRWVGTRYRDHDNLIWLNGGDYSPPRPAGTDLVNAVAEGILEVDQRHLHTAHCGPEDSAIDAYPTESWLALNNTYSYLDPLWEATLFDYNRTNFRAFFLLESAYENGFLGASPARCRRQAWWANLTGTTGQIFGNEPVWLFGGGWPAALDAPAAQHMAWIGKLFERVRWWTLVPDQDHELLIAGFGSGTSYIAAAWTEDRDTAVVYVPPTGTGTRSFTVDLREMSRPVNARWYNPTTGVATLVPGSPLPNTGMRGFTTPGNNGTGTNDWVLWLNVPRSTYVPGWPNDAAP